jgi:alkylation response protein AidB-like acyl-CoA dehydrogenase
MGTVSRLPEKIRMIAPIIESEAEAFDSVHDMARELGSTMDENPTEQADERSIISAVANSGLLGISTPSEAGGADVSNALLGEIVLKVAANNRLAAAYLTNHLYCVELLRNLPLPGPAAFFHARALAGDVFHLPDVTNGNAATLLPEMGKPGWRLHGSVEAAVDLIHADWVVVICPMPSGGDCVAFLPRITPGMRLSDNQASFQNVHVDSDCLFEIDDLQSLTAEPLGQLLKSAERLGWAESKLNDTLARHVRRVPPQTFGQDYLSLLGLTVSRLESGKAALERAGGKIDVAQVNPGETTIKNATFSAAIALSSAAEAFDLATELNGFHPQGKRDGHQPGTTPGHCALDIDPYGHVPIGATILDGSLH